MANICDKISKEQFDAAYNQFLPNGWIKFAFRYFSQHTEKRDLYLKKNVTTTLLSLFLLGFLGTLFNGSRLFVGTIIITYSTLLAGLIIYLFSAVFLNNWRIRKIRKALGINRWEYEALVSNYYE